MSEAALPHVGRRGRRIARLWALVAAVVLAAIALQALPSRPILPARDHGSAFSASTIELAVAPRRDTHQAAQQIPVPLPRLPVAQPDVHAPALVEWPRVWPAVQARGPPPRIAIGPALSPRAPPAS